MPTTEHKAEVVEVKELNDELVAYRIVCCGEQCGPECGCRPDAHCCHDSWHTLHVGDPDHEAKLEELTMQHAAKHEAKLQWRAKNAARLGK